jgi:hypothetical protein
MGDQNSARGAFEVFEAYEALKSAELAERQLGCEAGLMFQVLLATGVK